MKRSFQKSTQNGKGPLDSDVFSIFGVEIPHHHATVVPDGDDLSRVRTPAQIPHDTRMTMPTRNQETLNDIVDFHLMVVPAHGQIPTGGGDLAAG